MALTIVKLGARASASPAPVDIPAEAAQKTAADDKPNAKSNVKPDANAAPDLATAALQGVFAPGVGATLLMHLFVEEASGRLLVQGPTHDLTLFFFGGEPVHLAISDGGTAIEQRLEARGVLKPATSTVKPRHPLAGLARRADPVAVLEALREEVRDFAKSLLAATSGGWAFFADERIVDTMPLTAVNPFGFALEARRRTTPPDALFRLSTEVAALVPAVKVGFANVSARLKAFTGKVDLADVIDGRRRADEVIQLIGLDPMTGGMVLQTLADTGLLRLLAEPERVSSRDRRRKAKASTAPALVAGDVRQLSQLARLPGGGGSEILTMYLEIKPEPDDPSAHAAIFGVTGSVGPAAIERAYQQRLAELDPRAIPPSANRPYLLARAEELRTKIERAYRTRVNKRPRAVPPGYQLLDKLGAGGMAEVFRGRPSDDPMAFVAIKLILPHLRADQQFSQMFLDEARLARRIEHANVVRVMTVGVSKDDLYLAMEFVDGCDLDGLVQRARDQGLPVPTDLMCRIIAEASAGLHAAHTARDQQGNITPILHRDVSPHNMLVSRMGDVKLSDFGIAKALGAPEEKGGGVRGKIPYMSPELLRGVPASVRSDVYAMAMSVYATLGRLPFLRGSDAHATMRAILNDPLPRLSTLAPDVSPILDEVLLRAGARDPEERQASAQQLQLDLEELLAHRPAVDVGAWARPLAGQRKTPGPPSRSITSIGSLTDIATAIEGTTGVVNPTPAAAGNADLNQTGAWDPNASGEGGGDPNQTGAWDVEVDVPPTEEK